MRARAANCVFWPGMDQAIQDVRRRCRTCDYIASSQTDEPSITAEPPVQCTHFRRSVQTSVNWTGYVSGDCGQILWVAFSQILSKGDSNQQGVGGCIKTVDFGFWRPRRVVIR